MLKAGARLFLPLTERSLDEVVRIGSNVQEVIEEVPLPGIASLVVVPCLLKLKESPVQSPERLLAETLRTATAIVEARGLAAFRANALSALDPEKIRLGSRLLAKSGITISRRSMSSLSRRVSIWRLPIRRKPVRIQCSAHLGADLMSNRGVDRSLYT